MKNKFIILISSLVFALFSSTSAKSESITLGWAAWDPANALVELNKGFTEETGIEVTNSIVGWGDIIPRATQGQISNTLPDICTSWQSATQILGEMGALYDVTDTLAMIQQAGNTPNPSAVLASTYQGTPHGIPRYSTVHGLTYRGDLLEQAGIDPPDYAYGWEEFVEVCERLNNPPDRYVLAGIGATFDAEKLIWNIMASNGATAGTTTTGTISRGTTTSPASARGSSPSMRSRSSRLRPSRAADVVW